MGALADALTQGFSAPDPNAGLAGGPFAASQSAGVFSNPNGGPSLMDILMDPNGKFGQGAQGDGMSMAGTPADAMYENQGPDISVQGDNWKPKKRSTLGFIGDVLLGAFGAKPAFGERKQRQSVESAMEGFTSDPMRAVRRIAQIDGMQDEAWKMYGQVRDDDRGDAAQNRLMGKDRESILLKATGLFGGVTPETYPMVRDIYNGILQRNGYADVASLPEEYDPELMKIMYTSGMTPNQQEMASYRKSRLGQQDRSLDIREKGTDSLIEHRQVTEGIQQQNANTSARKADIAQQNADTYKTKGKDGKPGEKAGKVERIKDSKGFVREIVYSPDGKEAFSRMGGRLIRYKVENGKLIATGVK